jgi:hypothetical protein
MFISINFPGSALDETINNKTQDMISTKDTDIIKLNDPFFIKNALVQSRGRRTGNADNQGTANPNVTLLHCSDYHENNTNMNRLMEFYDYYKTYIDDIIHTGDFIQSYYNQKGPNVWNFNGKEKILNCIGNHDSTTREGSNPAQNTVTSEQLYTEYFAPYINGWGVTYTPNVCYYYKDYVDSNLRLIVLDDMHWDSTQEDWLENLLDDAKTNNLHVVCAKHYANGSVSQKVEGCTFSDAEFNAGPYSAGGTNHGADIVNDFITGGGKFVCWLVGHYHGVDFGYIAGYENQLYVVAPTVSNSRSPSSIERIVNTKSQDAFYLVTIDTDKSWLKIIMVGADIDRTMRSRKMMCYDYENHELISCV